MNEKSTPKRPSLTHFLSLPIGHHPALRGSWAQISAAFLESSPNIPGLHESILIKPGSLHLTLGVLSLASVDPRVGSRQGDENTPSQTSSTPPRHSVDDALGLLQTLETPIRNILTDHGSLDIPLDYMDVMRSRPNQNTDEAHVIWAGPDLESKTGKLLKTVCDLVNSTFRSAGMLQDDRPLKLHCTLINTLYRKEHGAKSQKGRGGKGKKRIPFSFSALLTSSAYKQIAVPGSTESNPSIRLNSGPHRVNLGTWTVDEVQLCEMGSKNADGVYKSVGSISLR